MKRYFFARLAFLLMILLAGCEANSPERKQAEAIAKRNPLDNADQDAVTLKLDRKVKPPKFQKVQKVDAREAQYFAAKSAKVYHCRGCEYAGKLDSPIGFASCEDAERSGHIPCQFCHPREAAMQSQLPPPPDEPR